MAQAPLVLAEAVTAFAFAFETASTAAHAMHYSSSMRLNLKKRPQTAHVHHAHDPHDHELEE